MRSPLLHPAAKPLVFALSLLPFAWYLVGAFAGTLGPNPAVDHPRWSQATERRIDEGLFAKRRPTLPFNGYEPQVGQLYAGMDLRRFF